MRLKIVSGGERIKKNTFDTVAVVLVGPLWFARGRFTLGGAWGEGIGSCGVRKGRGGRGRGELLTSQGLSTWVKRVVHCWRWYMVPFGGVCGRKGRWRGRETTINGRGRMLEAGSGYGRIRG